MSIKIRFFLLLCGSILLCAPTGAQQSSKPPGQQPGAIKQRDPIEDVVRVNTRVVFVDTLVRDKKTGVAVTDLPLESFQVLDDGKPRQLTYFSREGLARRPLALVLVLDLYTSGILFLEKPEVMESIISALVKLKPEDEVAVFQTWYEPRGRPLSFQLKSKMIEGLTRDRAKTIAALRQVQQFAKVNLPQVKIFFSFKEAIKGSWRAGIAGAAGVGPIDPPVETTAASDFEYMIDKAPLLAKERPESQVVIMEVTDDFGTETFGKTKSTARNLIASGVTVSGLTVKRNLMDKAVNITGLIISPLMGSRFHTISYYGKQTGGEVGTVGRPEEFAGAVDRIISGLAGRYSLGFTLGESERNDDRVHKLEVKARDLHGRNRKLTVIARRSYVPKADR
ncbi:MAG: hypothetical protein ABI923_12035 [bacterium]